MRPNARVGPLRKLVQALRHKVVVAPRHRDGEPEAGERLHLAAAMVLRRIRLLQRSDGREVDGALLPLCGPRRRLVLVITAAIDTGRRGTRVRVTASRSHTRRRAGALMHAPTQRRRGAEAGEWHTPPRKPVRCGRVQLDLSSEWRGVGTIGLRCAAHGLTHTICVARSSMRKNRRLKVSRNETPLSPRFHRKP